MTSQHIPFEQLVGLAANRLADEEVKQMRSHLADCSECASRLAALEQRVNPTHSDNDAGVRSDLASLDINRMPATKPAPSVLKCVTAALTFDSRQLSSAFGIRSGQSVARQLLFSVGEHDLDLRVAPDDGAWVLSGKLLVECLTGRVELRGENITESAAMNDLCEFYLPRVPPGNYSLVVHTPDMEIEVPEFELRA